MGRRLRLVVPMSNPEAGHVIVVPGEAYRLALKLAADDRRRLEVRVPPPGMLAEVVVHNGRRP